MQQHKRGWQQRQQSRILTGANPNVKWHESSVSHDTLGSSNSAPSNIIGGVARSIARKGLVCSLVTRRNRALPVWRSSAPRSAA